MYFIQSLPNDTGSLIAIIVISYLISVWILYVVIKNATSAGTRKHFNELSTSIDMLLYMKREEMKRQGFSEENINDIWLKAYEQEHLQNQVYNKKISLEEAKQKEKNLIPKR